MNSVTTRLIRPVGLTATDRPVAPADNKERLERTVGAQVQLDSAAEDLIGGSRPSAPTRLSLHLYSPGDDSKIVPNALGGTLDMKG